MLNVPDNRYVSPNQFWTQFNRPWLSNSATTLGDRKTAATETRALNDALKAADAAPRAIVADAGEATAVAGSEAQVLFSGGGGTGKICNPVTGQGIYVLSDESGAIKYVGRGDAPARLATHADSIDTGDLIGEVLWTNNLAKRRPKF